MKIVKKIGHACSIASIAVYLITNHPAAAVAALGFASFNIGVLAGERSRK